MAFVGALLVPAGASFHGDYGSFLESTGDDDLIPALQDAPGSEAFCFGYIEDSTNNPDDASKYAWFLHVDADGGCDDSSPESQSSWLITGFGGSAQQKWISSGDTEYTGSTFDELKELTTAATWMCYLESDGVTGYSIGDPIYIKESFSTGGSQSLAQEDLRIAATSSSVLAAMSVSVGIVKDSDADYKRGGESSSSPPTADPSRLPISRDMTCGNFKVKLLNLGSLGNVNSQDVFYIHHSGLDTENTPFPGMLRITSTSGISNHGQKVTSGNTDTKLWVDELASSAIQLVVSEDLDDDESIFDDAWAIQQTTHPAGGNSAIRKHDIFVKRGTGHSASSPGSLVTSAPTSSQIGVGSSVDSSTNLDARIYYVDTSPTGVYDNDDPVYIKHPSNSDFTTVEEGDVRVDVDDFSKGTSVRTSDTDYVSPGGDVVQNAFSLKLLSKKSDTRLPLNSVSNGKFINETDSSIWDPTTDPVFITSASKMESGMDARQIWNPDTQQPVNIIVDCDGNNPIGETGSDDWCGDENSLKSGGKLKTTGQKSAWLDDGEDDGDRLYWSDDNFLSVGDYRMGHGTQSSNHVSTNGQVAAGDGDVSPGARFQSSDTTLFASVHSSFAHPTAGDIQLYPSFGTRWDSSTNDAVPRAQTPSDIELVRGELGGAGGLLDDVYYLDFSADGDFKPGRVLRLIPYEDNEAGSFVGSSNTIEIQATKQRTSDADDTDHFGYIDNGASGLGTNDFVYLNLPSSVGGDTGQTLTKWDARLSVVDHGSSSFDAGTQVMTGDGDLQSFSGDSLGGAGDGTSTGDGAVLWWDANLNNVVDQNDALWLRMRDDGVSTGTPTYLDVRLNGPPATGGGGSGGGSDPSDPDTRPSSSFTVDVSGRTITLNAGESVATSGRSITNYEWEFGDGNDANRDNPTTSHRYDEEGQYTVRLTVKDSQGETSSTTRTVQTEGYVPPETPTEEETLTETDDENETETDTDPDDETEEEDTPGPAVLAILAVLSAVVVGLRRRR